jgi:hypothetical protein
VLCLHYHCYRHKNKPTQKNTTAAIKQTHPKKNGPAGRRDGLRVAVNRRMTGWMKCPSSWMDRGTTLGEASFNIPSTETVRPTEASFHPLSGFRGSRPNARIQGKLHLVGFTLALLYVICNDVQFGIVPPRNAQVVDSRAMATRAMAVNLVVHSWMPSCPGLNWQKFFSGPLHWWDSTRRLEKVGKCNMLMKVCAAFCVLMMPFMPGMWRIHGWSAWSAFLVVDKRKVSRFQTQEDMGSSLAWGSMKPATGGSWDRCNSTRHRV